MFFYFNNKNEKLILLLLYFISSFYNIQRKKFKLEVKIVSFIYLFIHSLCEVPNLG